MANNSIELCRMPVDHVCWSDCDPAADEHYHPPIGNEVEQMKPCPFCPNGGKPWAWRSHDPKAGNRIVWCIACESCACEGPEAATESEASERWNTRASTTSPAGYSCDECGETLPLDHEAMMAHECPNYFTSTNTGAGKRDGEGDCDERLVSSQLTRQASGITLAYQSHRF